MDPNFTFPTRPRPTLRPSPTQPPSEPANRESNALRASVLDAALELGLGSNKTVANWMFNHTLEEDKEEEEAEEDSARKAQLSPTSEEYAPYSTPPTSIESHSESFRPDASSLNTSPATSPQVHFPPVPAAPAPASANKLRKPRRDGYESDGGYVSDGGKKGRARTKSKPTKPDVAVVFPISEPMELIPVSKEERKRKKKAAKTSKDAGVETDTEDVGKSTKSKSKKTKKGSTDPAGGYETDDGYVSSSGKPKTKGRSRFFSLRKKSDSASEPPAEAEPVPPLPEREVFDLPIASRFATTLGTNSAVTSATPSRSETPLLPPSRPFASASGSSSPSLTSSSANSLLTPGDQDSFSPVINTSSFTEDDSLRSASTPDRGSNSKLAVVPASQEHRSISPQPPNAKSKFLISYPLTRTASPGSPPGSGQQSSSPLKPKTVPGPILLSPNPPNTEFNSRSASPGPSPIGSPFVLLTPINTNARAPSPALTSATSEIIPSTDYVVPSRSVSPLPPSPNVLAYYDVPPPSPPPSGPLPRPPPPSAMREATGPGLARLRSMSRERGMGASRLSPVPGSGPQRRSVSPSPDPSPVSPWSAGRATSPIPLSAGVTSPASATSPVQRGRAAPFPSQPILQTRTAAAAGAGASVGPGLAARAKVQRYRDLYAIQIPDSPDRQWATNARERMRGAQANDGEYDDNDVASVNIRVDEGSDGEEDEMAGVLGRFHDTRTRERSAHVGGRALERNNSGALRAGQGTRVVRFSPEPSPTQESAGYWDDDEASQYPDEERTAGRSTMYRFDNGSSGGGARDTMYTETSRASFLDMDKSEQARGRLVDRVGAMYDLSGRERTAIPPVPKLPPELLAGGNRF